MAILLHTDRNPHRWVDGFAQSLPGREVRIWPDVGDADEVEYLVAWMHDWDDLANYPKLRAILLVSAGIDHVDFGAIPSHLPVVRLVDPEMSDDLAEYCTHWVTYFSRHFDVYRAQQADHEWSAVTRGEPETVGILGLGAIGTVVAERLEGLDHSVISWSRSPKSTPFGPHFSGSEGLEPFLEQATVLINLLPLSEATRNLLDADALGALGSAALINAGRGATVDNDALLAALDGQLRGAVLDVFPEEPLGPDSALWSHPKVIVTPHVAGETNPVTASAIIAENIRRLERGEKATPLVDANTY